MAQLALLKNVRLEHVVKAISGASIVPFDHEADAGLQKRFERAARLVFDDLRANPMVKARVNEAGNGIEDRCKMRWNWKVLRAEKPKGKSGKLNSSGYPDLVVTEEGGSLTYVECNTFNDKTRNLTFAVFTFRPRKNSRHIRMPRTCSLHLNWRVAKTRWAKTCISPDRLGLSLLRRWSAT